MNIVKAFLAIALVTIAVAVAPAKAAPTTILPYSFAQSLASAPVDAPVALTAPELASVYSEPANDLPEAGTAQNVVYAFVLASTMGYYAYSWYLKRRPV